MDRLTYMLSTSMVGAGRVGETSNEVSTSSNLVV